LVATLPRSLECDVDAGRGHEGVVVVVHEGEEHAPGAVAPGLLPAPLLIREVEERLRRRRAEESSVRREGPEVFCASGFLDQVGAGAARRQRIREEWRERHGEQEDRERGEEQGPDDLVSHAMYLLETG